MQNAINLKTVSTIVGIATLLTACGGGGGGGSGVATTTSISEAQALPVAQTVNSDTSNLLAGSLSGLAFIGQSTALTTGAVSKTASGQTGLDENTTLKVVKFVKASQARSMVAGVTENLPCDTGSLVLNYTEKNPDVYSAGDTVGITSQDCVLSGDRIVGSFNLVIADVRGDPFTTTGSYGFTFNVTYSSFGVVDIENNSASISGGMTLVLDEDLGLGTYSAVAKGSQLTGNATLQGMAPESVTIRNYNIATSGNASSDLINYAGNVSGKSSTLGDYSYNITTPASFTVLAADFYPSSGSLVIKGSNASVTVTAISNTTVQIDYTDASGTKSQTRAWTEFDA